MSDLVKLVDGKMTVTSLVVAKEFDRAHRSVLRSLHGLIEDGTLAEHDSVLGSYPDANNQPRALRTMTERGFLIAMPFIGGAKSREGQVKLVDAFMELRLASEPQTMLEMLELALVNEKAKVKLQLERDVAVQTKAEIGSRREATAMATASVATKRAAKLEIVLDESKSWCSVKRMEQVMGGTYCWRELKRASKDLSIGIKKVFDQNYGQVNAYHADVWWEAYGILESEFNDD